jgi:hypothetical protein
MTTTHGGFLIPNADGVFSTKMSEPDQIDFNILGNSRWGVVYGCDVTVSGTVASTAVGSNGVALVNGTVVAMTGGQSVTLGAGGSQPRFDLIGVNIGGTLVSIPGSPAADPLFPDVPANITVLAAVYVPIGSSQFESTYTDKRNMLQPVFVATVNGDGPVLLNRYAGNDVFRIDGNGRLEWNNSDTYLYRSGVGTLRLHSSFVIDSGLNVGSDAVVAGDALISGDMRSYNLRKEASFPSAPKGTILQYTGGGANEGRVYIQTSSTVTMNWEEISTASNTNQPGDIKQSMRSAAQMPGWIPLAGQRVTEDQYPLLFLVEGLQPYITNASPRYMDLPNATQRTLIGSVTPGVVGGSDTVTLSISNLPSHSHSVSVNDAGEHDHTATSSPSGGHSHGTVDGGTHDHKVIDNGHKHGPAVIGQGYIMVDVLGDSNLDSVQADMSHSWRTKPWEYTAPAKTGIQIDSSSGSHDHVTTNEPNHTHTLTVDATPAHSHTVNESTVGNGAPVNIVPKYLTVYTYIKV